MVLFLGIGGVFALLGCVNHPCSAPFEGGGYHGFLLTLIRLMEDFRMEISGKFPYFLLVGLAMRLRFARHDLLRAKRANCSLRVLSRKETIKFEAHRSFYAAKNDFFGKSIAN